MDLISIFLVALGLSVDSFAASVSSGLAINRIRFTQAVRIAFFLAVFQGGMPYIGWAIGNIFKNSIVEYDHWIAFILLAGLGGKMVYDCLTKEKEENHFNPLKLMVLISISIATSIDALIVGISFALIEINILVSAIIIAIITFLASMIGMLLGKKMGEHVSKKLDLLGGVVLIILGLKILIEHLLA